MPATKKGIYHNLMESKYVVSNSEITFYFSSRLYRDKFIDGYQNNRETFTNKIERLVSDAPLNMDVLADIQFYKSIEKRGFFARLRKAKISWDDLYKYALRKMNEPNSFEWVIG
jgi:hypothetical protein